MGKRTGANRMKAPIWLGNQGLICPKCKQWNKLGSRICNNCGAELYEKKHENSKQATLQYTSIKTVDIKG